MKQNFLKLLKTNIEKMPVFRLSMMFMKTNDLNHSLQDVDENKGVIENEGEEERRNQMADAN